MNDANPPALTLAIDDATGVIDVTFKTKVDVKVLDLQPNTAAEILANRLLNAAAELLASMKEARQ